MMGEPARGFAAWAFGAALARARLPARPIGRAEEPGKAVEVE